MKCQISITLDNGGTITTNLSAAEIQNLISLLPDVFNSKVRKPSDHARKKIVKSVAEELTDSQLSFGW